MRLGGRSASGSAALPPRRHADAPAGSSRAAAPRPNGRLTEEALARTARPEIEDEASDPVILLIQREVARIQQVDQPRARPALLGDRPRHPGLPGGRRLGAKVIARLVTDLRRDFPEMTGLSPRNLNDMRALAAAFSDPEIAQQAVARSPEDTWFGSIRQSSPLRPMHPSASSASRRPARRWSEAGRRRRNPTSAASSRHPADRSARATRALSAGGGFC